MVQQEQAAPKAIGAAAKGRATPPTCSLIPVGCPQVWASGNPKHPGDTWVLHLIWRCLEMRRNPNECWAGRRYGEGQGFIEALHFHLISLLIARMVQELLNLRQVIRFCAAVVVLNLLGSILVFVHLSVCFLCTEGKSWLDY